MIRSLATRLAAAIEQVHGSAGIVVAFLDPAGDGLGEAAAFTLCGQPAVRVHGRRVDGSGGAARGSFGSPWCADHPMAVAGAGGVGRAASRLSSVTPVSAATPDSPGPTLKSRAAQARRREMSRQINNDWSPPLLAGINRSSSPQRRLAVAVVDCAAGLGRMAYAPTRELAARSLCGRERRSRQDLIWPISWPKWGSESCHHLSKELVVTNTSPFPVAPGSAGPCPATFTCARPSAADGLCVIKTSWLLQHGGARCADLLRPVFQHWGEAT